ncbi:MAG: GTPase CgtA, partial [Aphanizomenon flos-aquae WA102]
MQFIDQSVIEVEAGNGGDGIVAFRREKYVPAGGPSGGNGGKGGSVIFVADTNLQTLLDFRYKHLFKAPNGERSGAKNWTGAGGKDLIMEVTCGTDVYDAVTRVLLSDIVEHGQNFRVDEGGKGGLGNQHFLRNSKRAPEYS